MLYLFDQYELDEQDFCLSRSGQRISIEPKALRVLIVLISSHGRLIEKRAIVEAVWKGSFVEESTLTRAIAILRKQLEDDPRSPKYIETVPTLGYRFIAPVEIVYQRGALPLSADVLETGTLLDLSPSEPTAPVAPHDLSSMALPVQPRKGRVGLYATIATIFALIGIAYGVRFVHSRTLPMSAKDTTIVLADFANTSGDAVFDDTLRRGMIVQLEQSPVLRLASDGQIRATLRLMAMSPDASLTAEVSREVCQRINAGAVLDGSISRLGSQYVLELRARSCSTGEVLDAEQIQVARKEDALDALSRIAVRFRTHVGESITSIKKLDISLAEATTPSLEALKAFSQAAKAFNANGSGAAIPLFQHAIELDPQFAMAHVWLGRMYADFGEEGRSIESTRRAYELRGRASDRERFTIDASYDLIVSGNLVKARETCEAWTQMYPRDPYPRGFLSGIIYPALGQYEKALEEGKKTIEIDPNFVVGYRNIALNFIALNRLADAEAILRRAADRKLFLASFVTDSYRIAFLKGDTAGMKRATKASPTNPWLMNYEASTLARAGHLALAREMSVRAMSLAQQASRPDTEAQLEVAAAFLEAAYGDPLIARKMALLAHKLSQSRNAEYGAAYVLAITKDSSNASKLTADLAVRFPDDTLVQYDYVPTLQALLALNQHQPEKAIELLRTTLPYELSQPLHPIYIRGQAFLAMGHPSEAAIEFEKILGHPGLILNDPLSVLTRLQLGRAYVLLGDKTRARTAYENVLNIWSDADPGIPIRQQARLEYDKLCDSTEGHSLHTWPNQHRTDVRPLKQTLRFSRTDH